MRLLLLLLLMERATAQQRGLFPAILNLASNAVISSNATCGDPEPEVYCKLVEHVPGRRIKNPHCPKCDANSVLSKERHPITNAIDGTNQWWQSPSIKNGRQFHWITITLDLKQIFQVAYIIIKAANSPRPGNWILERSLDGVTFHPWQFYAISDSECLSRYNVTPRLGPPTYKHDTEVICTSYYSRLNPLEHGEIHTSLINGRPGADDLTSDLLNFTSARHIRLRLQRIRTLNADLMTLSARDPRDIDPIVTRRYYYSIKDISVGGMCICYGHAQSCPLDPVTKKLQCVCEHNTCGESCNECCPGYHQQPWQPGTVSEGNTCEKCNCHNKAVDCFYNQTVSDLSLSVNTRGARQGGGVCIDCQQHTAGINCETCSAGYYRPAEVSPYSDSPCVECNCDPRGSESSVCRRDDTQPGVPAGQCVCKEGFAGRQCDVCAFGYRDFPQCVRCECNLSGSINTDPCSPCTCKVNVMGAHCDLCKPGFYNLQDNNQLGCTDCFCFGVSNVCESSAWFYAQAHHTDAWLRPSPSLHTTSVVSGNDLGLPSNTSSLSQQMLSWSAPHGFLGNKLGSYGGFLRYSLTYGAPLDNEDRSVPTHSDIIIEGNGRVLRHVPPLLLFLSPLAERSVAVAIAWKQFLDVQTGLRVTRDDLLSVLADLTSLRVRVHLNTSTDGPIRLGSVSLDVADSDTLSGIQAVSVETCECPWGYSGTSCEACLPGFYRVGGVLFGGNCMQCECNDHATECDDSGVCLGCAHNTTGPHCDQCLPGFYGDATEGTADDCQLCPCPLTSPSNSFSPTCVLDVSGQVSCDQCQDGYTGTNCERCASGFYGNPQVVGGACVRCECNGNVDVSEAGHCDTVTGECLRCLGNTAGKHCEVCQPGYYGDAVHTKDCRACGCDVSGSLSSVCDVTTGQCSCRANVTGRTCDRCQSGFFGLKRGQGCQACDCNQSGSVSESCDEEGRCLCGDGVGGDKCDRCNHGYYDFKASGCTACTCNHTGGNCDPVSGECICPAHTEGVTCDRCETGHWGHDPTTGCKPCSCSAAGSSEAQCDLTNGQCPCREGFSGRSCDHCSPGYHGYPACSPCSCDVAGTDEKFCNTTQGVCDCRHTGECECKVGVSGRRCEECVPGWFGLWAQSPDGCSRCYCSGLSSDCEEQGGLHRVPISLAHPPAVLSLVSQSDLQGVVSGVYQQGGDMLLDTRQLSTKLAGPLYWRLPPQFNGPQLMSYGGLLSYIITFYAEDGLGLSNQEPQVLMRGGTLRKLVIYTDMVAPGNGVRTQHDIRMTEHKWKYFNAVSERSVSRADFMSILRNIEYIIIKASYGTRLQQSRISNITMETAVEALSDITGGVARLIESCICPPGYSGLSCQECAAGFFHQPLSELSSKSQKSLFARPCVRCRCNNHSESCDPESGECQECEHHTSGRSCELCAPGYYGNVSGSISDCSLCACPLRDNSFSPTCVSEGALGDFRCTACQTGYEGRYCERCSVGYYGNPSLPGGGCSPCSCSKWGSQQPVCDAQTGQCECKAGVRGQSCDQCEQRHVQQEGECVSCEDDCTGVLLDDLEKIHSHFLSVNLSGVAMAPYRQLVLLKNTTRDIQVHFSENGSAALHLSRAENKLNHLASDVSTLLQQVTHVSNQLEKVDASTNSSLSQSALLLENISSLQDRIHEVEREAGHLNQTTEDELSSANQTRLLDQVESMLGIMRAVHMTGANATANQELREAQSLVDSLQVDFLSSTAVLSNRLRPLSTSLTVGMEMLQHGHTQLTEAARQNAQTHNMLEAAHTKLHDYQSVRHNLSVECVFVGEVMEDSQLLMDDTVGLTEALTNFTTQVEVLGSELDQWRPLLRKQVDGLVVGLKMSDALENVYRAENHAHLLQSLAHSLHSSLSSVCNASQNGSRLVQLDSDISERVDSAQRAASVAHLSASLALNATGQSEQLLTDEGGAKLNLSSAALEKSRQLSKTAEDLKVNVSMVTSRLGFVRESVRNASILLRQPIKDLQSLSNSSTMVLQQAHLQAAAAQSSLQEALKRLHRVKEHLQVSSSVVENTDTTVRETNHMVTHTQTEANEAQRRLEEVEHRTERLMDRIKPLGMLGETLSRNLSDIRELIEQARRQAASIKVAVQADRDCIRSYRPQIESSNFNTLSLTLKTSSPDNLLFYLGSNTSVDFMAVEMHAGKVSLVWDVGSGSTRLEFPGLDITNNRWTRINATRFGARGSLSVHQLESELALLPAVTAISPGPSRVLDINRNTVIHIGGLGAHTQSPTKLRSSTFQGCLGEASLNGRNIGLWNYESREGECSGCFSSPQAEETSFHFDGSGFSMVQKSLRATSTSIVLLFKTLSPGGLLLYLASNNTRDFLSMELVEGRVRLTFDLGSGALIQTSNRKYNTGVWYKITLQRSKRKGYLSIMAADQSSEKEVLEAESPGTASDLNRSDLDPIYIGGLPASRPIRRQVISRSYVGCIKSVEIARSNFDLLRDSFGVRKGCVLEEVRSVSVLSGGFVQIAPRSLGPEAELLFSFSTNNQSGILLAAFGDEPTQRQHFLSVHLASGALEAELGEVGRVTRRVMVMKPDGGSFSDGRKHSVIVTIKRKSLSMQVDEEHIKSVALLPGGFPHLSPASFFIGGLPAGEESRLPIRIQEVSRWFRGCIQHLVVGGELVDLSGAVRYEGVELDSCLLEERVRGAVLPDDQDVEPTHDPAHLPISPPTHLSALTPEALTCVLETEPSVLPSSAQFGLSKHSHMTFIINPDTVRRSVTVRLSVRSRALDGLIFLLSDSKQMDFIVLRLTGGKLMMSADLGKGPSSITSPVTIQDGEWHTVSAEVSRRSLSMSVDGSGPKSVSIKGNQLDVDATLYLGGVPHTHTTRRINVSSSFPGCVRSVSLNGATLDLLKPASQHDVTSCFTNDQTGSFFNGSGYAEFMRDGYKVGSDMSVSLEFRTSQSEGVFLGISSAKVDAIGLEMTNGQVVFNVNNGAGRLSVSSIGQMLCDGQWHHLLARKTKHMLSLTVDGRSYTTPNPYPQSTSAETNNPVYLGGYPAGVKQNCLSISSRFRGCLRNVQLVKSHLSNGLDLSAAHSLLGVTPYSCPVA